MKKELEKTTPQANVVVEWAPFQLAPDTTEEQLLRAAHEIQDAFLQQQPGFLRRELLRARDGGFVDVLHWRDQAAVDAAMQIATTHPACARYFACMASAEHDPSANGMLFFERVSFFPERGTSS
jgi:hypothetical protein